ncbi:Spy0128 family protein [uncultured Pseudoramibacter sp.]|uniref:Spy0128 family protein n=1 Tax=uncultured Pseudoramibacter sp. TaxID=1623493 RepID=UPI0025DE6BF6|nr:FctA domain-containing protein [uncultured Pseudoramibacter sp.]
MEKQGRLFVLTAFLGLLLVIGALPSRVSAAGGADKTSNFHAVITSQSDTWSNGVTATYSVDYTIDQGSMSEGDYVIVSIPQNIVSDVDWAVSSQHFSQVVDLKNGQYKLVFGAGAQSSLSGSFAMNLTMKNDTDTSKSGTISIGGAAKTLTVNPSSSSSGTVGEETRAIDKDVNDTDVAYSGYDYSDGRGNNAKQIGIINSSTDGVYTYRLFVNKKKTNMANVTVSDTLPGGMHFLNQTPTVEYYESGSASETVDPSLYQLTCVGDKLTFTYPGALSRCIQISYKVSVDDTKNAKYTNSASIDYTENGKAYSEHVGYVLQGKKYSAVNGEKQVNKTEITNANQDQQVMYSFKFWNNKVTEARKINFSDTLDSHVRFDGAVSSDYFSITQDAQNPHVIHVTNKLDLPADKTFYARFFVNMSGVPAGYTVMNTAGGNTVYTTKKAEVALTATKTLNGKAPGKDNIYQFELCDSRGKVLQTKINGADGRIAFDPIEYGLSDVGKTFDYTVREKQGADTKTTYDSSVYQVSVKVAQDGKEQPITTTTTIVKKGQKDQPGQSVESMTFANSQELAPATASITAVKSLSGRALKNGEFSFTLTAQDKAPMPEGAKDSKLTVTNDGTAVNFGKIIYNKAGSYTYTIKENSGDLGGVTYDTSERTVTVNVNEDTQKGTLNAVVNGAGSAATFSNTYKARPATADITAQKTLTGRSLKSGEFSFTLTANDNAPMPSGAKEGKLTVKNNGSSVDFGSITYDKAGTYTYAIQEEKGSLGGVGYDGSIKTVTVTVTDDGLGQLKAAVSGDGKDAIFRNTYQTGTVNASITAVKSLEGRTLKPHEFSFTLTGDNHAPMPKDAKDGKLTVKNNGAAVDFGSITYDKAGTYNYTIQEEKGSLGGVTYDGSTKTVKVTVADRGDGTLSATVDGAGSSATFKNIYAPKPIATSFFADKVLTGRTLKDGEFSFTISAAAGTPMPDKTTAVNKADGTIDFGKVTFDQAGTYTYAIKENGGQVKGVTYDSSVKNIVAEVTDDGSGQLQVKVTGNGKAATFKNTYQAAGAAIVKGQKTVNGKASGNLSGFTFTLTPINAQGVGIGEPMKAVTAADGSFVFDAIQYELNDVGTYDYLLDETNLPQGYQKDFQPKRVRITVTDNGDGTLKTVVADMPKDGLMFNNTHKTTHVAPIVPTVGKVVKTGDTTNIIGWMVLALAASVGLVMINKKREIKK